MLHRDHDALLAISHDVDTHPQHVPPIAHIAKAQRDDPTKAQGVKRSSNWKESILYDILYVCTDHSSCDKSIHMNVKWLQQHCIPEERYLSNNFRLRLGIDKIIGKLIDKKLR